MSSEKATALVLRLVEWSETSYVVTLFTQEFGKTRGIAKGGRRLKGPFESALDLLATCRVVFLRKSSDALDLLTEARLEQRFRPAGRDMARWYAGYYIAELLNELTDDYDPHPLLFDAARQALAGLRAEIPVAPLLLRFELVALRLLGHLPVLASCSECGDAVEPRGRVAFGQLSGGVLCARCRPGKKQVVSVSAEVIRAMEQLAEAENESWQVQETTGNVLGEMRGVVNHYICGLLGHRPRMHSFLGIRFE
ncbi:MAG: DNA repair protein RecO [Pirellulales bacterium]